MRGQGVIILAEQKFIYSETYGKLRDFFGTFVNALKHHDINEIILDKTNPADSFLSESFSRLSDALTPYRSELELFAYKNETGISFILSLIMDKLVECSSINGAIKILRETDSKKLRYDALTFFDRDLSNPTQLYNELLGNQELLLKYIIALSLPVNIKYHLIRFINTPDAMMSELVDCLNFYAPIFEKEYSACLDKYSSICAKLKETTENTPMAFIKEHEPHCFECITTQTINDVVISPWLYRPNSFSYFKQKSICFILFGCNHINKNSLLLVPPGYTTDMFNTFCSQEKYRIFLLLSTAKDKISAAEIALKLEIAPPTLAHYLRSMCNNDLILKVTEGRRVFYKINMTYFNQARNYINIQEKISKGRII